jgi:hypothetical protein
MRGLDPRIHPALKLMDCRVRPGNDAFAIGAFPEDSYFSIAS